MLKRAASYVNQLDILQYFLDFSEPMKVRGKMHFCLHSYQFSKVTKFSSFSFKGKEMVEKEEKIIGPSRKKFRTYLDELLKEKLITRIEASDRRAKYFSITPWGLCFLIKSEASNGDLKIHSTYLKKIIDILETFATVYVKPYNSKIFNDEKFDFKKLYERLVPEIITEHDLGEELWYVFTNFDYSPNIQWLELFLTPFYNDSVKFSIATFRNLNENEIIVSELGQRPDLLSTYRPIVLNEIQFHHYFVNMLISLIIYFHVKLEYNSILSTIEERKAKAKTNRRKPRFDDLVKKMKKSSSIPEDLMRILFIFNNHIDRIIDNQRENMSNFVKLTNNAQFNT